ncbi:6-phosphofructokinase, partial [Sphingobacterium daejeonense]|uniref:6-phosphofructokinase n=1 Tax=Sphingobacterium daejeonense TaxID=371142 RepID=UPI003D31C8F2
IDALVRRGGEGKKNDKKKGSEEWERKIIGMPGTIDNDLNGTDFTIGYDTAINTVVDLSLIHISDPRDRSLLRRQGQMCLRDRQ